MEATPHTHGTIARSGVLLVNLGTPDAPTPAAVRRYLGEFLWDPRVIEIPRLPWWLILHGIVLRTRPRRAAHAYAQVWTEDGSPLLAIGRRQAAALTTELTRRLGHEVPVVLGMRYGNPAIAAALAELRARDVQRVLVLPLYPQYSAATSASTFDAVAAVFKTWRWLPELRQVMSYHDDPAYIQTAAASIREHWVRHGAPDKLLFSFHGMPQRTLRAGDPYHCHCQATARLIAECLELPAERWQISFQSRFGREAWLQPYTDQTLKAWPSQGIKHVAVVCPGFPADCLETLEEIALQNRDFFLAAGGESYHYIPCLNERPDHITALADLALRHLQGWPDATPGWDADAALARAQASRARAQTLGAPR